MLLFPKLQDVKDLVYEDLILPKTAVVRAYQDHKVINWVIPTNSHAEALDLEVRFDKVRAKWPSTNLQQRSVISQTTIDILIRFRVRLEAGS